MGVADKIIAFPGMGGKPQNSGIALAIASREAQKAATDIINYGRTWPGLLRFKMEDAGQQDGLEPAPVGARIAAVDAGSSAAAAGLVKGDVIVASDGQPIGYAVEVSGMAASTHPGEVHHLKVVRDGKELDVAIPMGGDVPPATPVRPQSKRTVAAAPEALVPAD